MHVDQLLSLGFHASLFLIVLATGMAAQRGEATALLRQPALLIRSVLAMLVLAPLLAVVLASTLPLEPAVRIALVALAVSPAPPFPPSEALLVGGDRSYAVSLVVTSALLSIITIPVSLSFLSDVFGLPLLLAPAALARQLLFDMLLPLVAGLLISRAAADLSATWAGTMGLAGALLLGLTALAQLPTMLSALGSLVGNGTLLVMASYATATLLIGHLIGGPDPERRTVLALSTAARHPAIAMSLAYTNFADERLAAPAVLLLTIVMAAVTAPYVMMTRRRHPTVTPTTQATRH